MTIQKLRYIIEVVNQGSINEALEEQQWGKLKFIKSIIDEIWK